MPSFSTSDRFWVLEARDRDRLEAISKLDRFPMRDRSILVSEWVYLIAEGKVEIRGAAGSAEVVLGQLGSGDLFGELEAFADLPAGTLRYVAVADTIVRAVNKHPLKQELKTHPLARDRPARGVLPLDSAKRSAWRTRSR